MAVCSKYSENGEIFTILCETNKDININSIVRLTNNKTKYSSINLINGIPENELEMPFNGYLNVKNFSFLYFNKLEDKWNFQLSLNYQNYYLLNNSKIIIGLLYNYKNSTATCRYFRNEYKFICIPDEEIQNINDSLSVSKLNEKATVTFSTNNLKIINLIFISSYEIYEYLHYEAGKYKFIIESKEEIETYNRTELKTLDIKIGETKSIASCKIDNKLLKCEVEAGQRYLIQLAPHLDADIKLMNIKDYYIPLKINLNFDSSYYRTSEIYQNYPYYFSFYIKAYKNENAMVIPQYSRFSMLIKADGKNQICICYSSHTYYYNGILTLSCQTLNKINQKLIIKLTNIKSNDSSITWIDEIADDKLDIILNSDLKIDNACNPYFNSTNKKWSFDINLNYYYNFQEDSKIIIDLIHSGQKTKATCRYNTENGYKFKCISDYEYQNDDDLFEISTNNIYNTVIFLDKTKIPILFNSRLKFEKAYNLTFGGYNEYENIYSFWGFNIKVSESNLTNNRYTQVDIRENFNYKKAICKIYNNILSCKSQLGSRYNPIYLVNKNSSYVKWIDLDNEEHIYLDLHINFEKSFGTFYNNKWIFNVIFYIDNLYEEIYNYNYALLDINVNNKSQTAICRLENNFVLKCECNYNNQNINDAVKISGTRNPNLGTIYFIQELNDKNKEFSHSEIDMRISDLYCSNSENEKKLSLQILGDLQNEEDFLENESYETFTEIKIKKICGDQSDIRAGCIVFKKYSGSYISLNCSTDNNFDLTEEGAKISIVNNYSQYVKFSYIDESYLSCNKTLKCNEGENISLKNSPKISLLFLISILLF